MRTLKKAAIAVAAVSALTMTAACGADDTDAAASSTATESASPMQDDTQDSAMQDGAMDPAANLVGPGCATYAEQVPEGAGSVQGMAQDPVAVAASNNPLLKTLVAAVSGQVNPRVDLVDTLNGDEFTVFAPVDEAFAEIDKKTVKALSRPANADLLTSILTYHVVPGQMTPDEVVGRTLTTVQGEPLQVSGQGDDLTVQDANVICGGVQTANATVYLIDSVLMPPSTS